MWPNRQETAYLVIITEEIQNGKLHFLCSDIFFSFRWSKKMGWEQGVLLSHRLIIFFFFLFFFSIQLVIFSNSLCQLQSQKFVVISQILNQKDEGDGEGERVKKYANTDFIFGSFLWYVRKTFRKTNMSSSLIRVRIRGSYILVFQKKFA